jgi:hypothetical protein
VELFDSLLQTPHVKVVKPPLPKSRQRIVATCKGHIQLSCRRSPLATQAARDALFQNLNHSGRRSLGWLADEQMNVLGHDVTHQGEAVTVAHFAKNMYKSISGANRAQKRQAPIAGEGNEMQMTASVAANEVVGHGRQEQSKPRPFKPERVGHPKKRTQLLGVDVLEWYYPTAYPRQQENTRKGVPPAETAVWGAIVVASRGHIAAGVLLYSGGCLDPSPFEPLTCGVGVIAGTEAMGVGYAGFVGAGYYWDNVVVPCWQSW